MTILTENTEFSTEFLLFKAIHIIKDAKASIEKEAIAYEKAKTEEVAPGKEAVPSGVLVIEGDGTVLKGKEGGNKEERETNDTGRAILLHSYLYISP